MQIEIITFGMITDFIAESSLTVPNQTDTDQLQAQLARTYPQLSNIKYKLALNNMIVQQNVTIPEGSTIAVMPPFSGG